MIILMNATREQAFATGYHEYFEKLLVQGAPLIARLKCEKQVQIWNFGEVYLAWQRGFEAAKEVLNGQGG